MLPLQWMLLMVIISLILCSLVDASKKKKNKNKKSKKNGKNNADEDDGKYYDIYQAIDSLNKLTSYQTFYQLLDVSPEASDEQVSRAFRKLALKYHPDKLKDSSNEFTDAMSQLVQSVGSLLRSEGGRRRYDWILNEAPAWHREAVYYSIRKNKASASLSLSTAIIIAIIASIIFPFISQWISYFVALFNYRRCQQLVKNTPVREVERLKQKLMASISTMTAPPPSDSLAFAILKTEDDAPSMPTPLDLWPIRLITACIRPIYNRIIPSTREPTKQD